MRPLLAAALLALPLIPAGRVSSRPPAPTGADPVGHRLRRASSRPEPAQSLDQRLEAWERSTGHQFIVWIGPTSGDSSPEDFATKAFEAGASAQQGEDDGLALFVFAEDRKVRFEVGYGLEGTLPDAVASRIIREAMLPRLAAGDRDGAVTAGVDAAIARDLGTTATPRASRRRHPRRHATAPARSSPPARSSSPRIVGLLFLLLLVTNPRLAIWLLINIVSSSGGGRLRWRRGSWSGGGGRSGGGGATGSW